MRYRKQITIALLAYLGNVSYGFIGGWSSPVVPKLAEDPDLLGGPNDLMISVLIVMIYIGAFGSMPMSLLSNTIGRKPVLIFISALFPISFLSLALFQNIYSSMFSRVCLGLASGSATIINLVYLGEIASTEIRGILLGTTGASNNVGFLIVYIVGHYLSYTALNFVGMAIGLLHVAGMTYVPESPLFILRKGRNEDAKAILRSLNRHSDADQLDDIKVSEDSKPEVKWSDLVSVKCNRKALLITGSLFTLQQLSGVGPLLMYTTTIFEASGSSIPPWLATIIIGVVQLCSGLITPLFIERFGRKFLLLVSTLTSCIGLALLSVYLNLDYIGSTAVQQLQWVPLPMAMVHFVAYSFGFGIIPNTLVGEMFELKMRSAGTAVVIVVSWVFGMAITVTFGSVVARVGIHVVFVFFSSMCGVAFLFTLFFVPETKGKSLMEIQKMLS